MPTHKELSDRQLYGSPGRRRGAATATRVRGVSWRHVPVLLAIMVAIPAGGMLLTPGRSPVTIAAAPPAPFSGVSALTMQPPVSSGGAAITGSALAGAGVAPALKVIAQRTSVTIQSRSLQPVSVSVSDGHGQPFAPWRTFQPGEIASLTVISGRSYGYCFAQASGGGYGAARACGGVTMHTYLNGVRAPDGQDVALTFAFQHP